MIKQADYFIFNFTLEYTGGGIWVGFSKIFLPELEKAIWASVSDELVAFYTTEEKCNECNDAFEHIWIDFVLGTDSQFQALALNLLARYILKKSEVY